MNDSLYIAATGMQAQQLSIDTIANNLANVSTTGFKKGRVNFQELMHVSTDHDATGTAGINSIRGIGISVDGVAKDFAPGAIAQTNSPLDVAINGNGFLEVTLADGSHAYSRGGTLQITKDSYLATISGHILKPAIHVPANTSSIVIGTDGKVSALTSAQAQPIEIGQLELANFNNPSALNTVGSGVFTPTEASGAPTYGKPGSQGLGTMAQGALENSNVSMVDEMVTLMITQRAYELSSKIIQASDEMMSLTNNLRR